MNKEETLYLEIGKSLSGAIQSQMFGKPCFKINGKAFICFFQNEMVFKLNGDFHKEAIALGGAKLFDPSGKNRAMKEWVQVPFSYKNKWTEFAKASFVYIIQVNK
ncbi:MAG: hypothetical protein WCK82_10985 [Bacteroidota bacterium]|jgi:hypothetical protein